MTARDEKDKFLPKEPLDLPNPLDEKELPVGPLRSEASRQEIPAHSETSHDQAQEYEQVTQSRVQTLLSWSAPGRPFQKRGKEFFALVVLIMLLLEVIAFLFSEYMLMLLILSFVFVIFALAIVPPTNLNYKISSEGLTIEDHFYLWQELYDFYFKRKHGVDILHVRTHALIPGALTISLGNLHREQIMNVLLPYLPYREVVQKNFQEKSADWLAKTFPLEKQHKTHS